jgi:phosphatidylinositol alpha-1,6-mannosyltransferase
MSVYRRIITLTHEFHPQKGGIATYTEEVARAAHEMGFPIEVWAPAHPDLKTEDFPFPVRTLPLKGTQSWPCRIALARYLFKYRNDWKDALLYLPEPGPIRTLMYLQLTGKQKRNGLAITLHGSEIERFSYPFYRRMLFGKLLERADRVGVVSRFSQDLLLEKFPHIAEKTIITPGATRSDLLECALKVPIERTNEGILRLLTVGRIHPRKGQLQVVSALAALPDYLKKMVIYQMAGPIGRPDYFARIVDTAKQGGIHIDYLGDIENQSLNQVYARADIFIMTSMPAKKSIEGFGLTYLEAGAYGLPVIAHRIGGVGDAVKDHQTGIKVEPDDQPGLTQAISSLITNPSLRYAMGYNGRNKARSFSWKATARLLFDDFFPSHRANSFDRTIITTHSEPAEHVICADSKTPQVHTGLLRSSLS